jgi:hypothetical protein
VSDYFEKVRATAAEIIRTRFPDWDDTDVTAGVEQLMDVGFGRPGMGATGRWAANLLRKVKPGLPYAPCAEVAGDLNRATIALTGHDGFDKTPYRCDHCGGKRYNAAMTPRSHFGGHRTVFDPQTW